MDDPLADATPNCPHCLVALDIEGEEGLIYLECPQCHDVFM